MSTPTIPHTPEARLAGQISALSDTLDDTLSLARKCGSATGNATASRHRELDKAMKIAERSAHMGIALAKLRASFTLKVQREPNTASPRVLPPPPARNPEAAYIATVEDQIEREMERDLGPAFTPAEFSTITNEELRARCDARQIERVRRRVARGLPAYPGDPDLPPPPVASGGSNVDAPLPREN